MKGSSVVTAGLDYANRKENFSRSHSMFELGTTAALADKADEYRTERAQHLGSLSWHTICDVLFKNPDKM